MKPVWRRRIWDLIVLLAVAGILGLIVMVSGVVPIKASSDHWPITRWVLDFSSGRSISFHSRGIDVPPLEDPKLITLGAATYENNCRWCHGAPGYPMPTPANQMTPHPPNLQQASPQWRTQELYYILQHGIKFAGMPAWAAENRHEDIWPTVAFLRAYPEMTKDQYEQLVAPDYQSVSETQLAARRCAACHGLDGSGRAGDMVPDLAGQNVAYLEQSLLSYRDGSRYSGIMQPIASRLDERQIADLAEYFAGAESESSVEPLESERELVERGRRLAESGDRDAKIPACVACHAAEGERQAEDYPLLAGQPAEYLALQLRLFRDRRRGGEHAELMHPVADKLDDQDIAALSTYFASRPPESQ